MPALKRMAKNGLGQFEAIQVPRRARGRPPLTGDSVACPNDCTIIAAPSSEVRIKRLTACFSFVEYNQQTRANAQVL